jgi:proline iminopeptidase
VIRVPEPYPEIEPYDHGLLDVGDGNHVYWETCGNPDGKPAVVVHGGPGQGCKPGMRRGFDPARYRIVLFDQRGCGRSTPHAGDPATDLDVNTTEHLIADMERLREHLGIEKWLLNGGSWGSTLAIAYAERYPHRVSEIVLSAITTTRRSEIDWLYRGAGRFFPEAWERFRDGLPVEERERVTAAPGAHELLRAYSRLLADPDPAVRDKAVLDYATWEDTVISLEAHGKPDAFSNRPGPALTAIVRICAHYFGNDAWLEDGALIRDADRLAGIPGVLIHGRLDLSGPPDTAWELVKRWPDAELAIIDTAGHQGSPEWRDRMLGALDRFAP